MIAGSEGGQRRDATTLDLNLNVILDIALGTYAGCSYQSSACPLSPSTQA